MSNEPIPLVETTLAPLTHAPTLYLATLGRGSRLTMATALENIAWTASGERHHADTFAWGELRYPAIMAVREALTQKYKPRTVNRHLCALRGVLKQAWILGQLSAEDYQRATMARDVPLPEEEAGRALDRVEIAALLAVVDGDASLDGVRNQALVRVLTYGGLRAFELCRVKTEVKNPLPVVGKRERLRYVPLPSSTMRHVAAWLRVRHLDPRRCGDHRLFPALCVNLTGRIVRRLAKAAGLGKVTPHDLRRTYLTLLLDRGCDPLLVAKLAGHRDVKTTQLYDRRGLQTLATTVERCLGPVAA